MKVNELKQVNEQLNKLKNLVESKLNEVGSPLDSKYAQLLSKYKTFYKENVAGLNDLLHILAKLSPQKVAVKYSIGIKKEDLDALQNVFDLMKELSDDIDNNIESLEHNIDY